MKNTLFFLCALIALMICFFLVQVSIDTYLRNGKTFPTLAPALFVILFTFSMRILLTINLPFLP